VVPCRSVRAGELEISIVRSAGRGDDESPSVVATPRPNGPAAARPDAAAAVATAALESVRVRDRRLAWLPRARRSAPSEGGIREGQRSAAALRRDALHRRLLATADVAAAGLALNLAIILGGHTPTFAVVAVMPLVVLVSKITGLYDRDEHVLRKTTLDEAPAIFHVVTAYTLLVWMLDGTFADGALSKGSVALLWVALLGGVIAFRALARRAAMSLSRPERCLAIGKEDEAREVAEKFAARSHSRAVLVGRVPLGRELKRQRSDDTLGVFDDLDFIIRKHAIDRVIVCPTIEGSGQMLDTIRMVKALGVKVSMVPRLLDVVGSSVEFDDFGGMTLLGLRRYDLTKSSAFLKRSLDLFGAGLGLLVLAPLLAVVAVAIKATSPGPVFFRQRRIGRCGEAFDMLKFRTMYDGADRQKAALRERNEASGLFKIENDPRCTPVGRRLRRASLDELPQLINVLRGEMSLVGPRPLVGEEDASIRGWRRRRLDVAPGMTGAWQVLGSSRVPLRDMVTIDYLYRANWSLWLDIKILLRTIPHVIGRRGM
jgi:exopolysaccharide biosynthesis polyprenyl glycosylphosphotransferase